MEWIIKLLLIKLVQQFPPVIGGIVILVGGIFIAREGVTTGHKDAQFVNGPQVVGKVIELNGKESIIKAGWRDQAGKPHTAVIQLFQKEFRALKRGDEIPLVLRKDDQSVAMVAKYWTKPTTVMGISTTSIGFLGAGMSLFGIWYALWDLLKPKARSANVPRPTRKSR